MLAGLLLVACGGGGGSAPASPTAGGEPFDIDVIPAEDPVAVRTVIPGQREVFLVTTDAREGSGAIAITARAELAQVEVEPATLEPGNVVEVTVVADEVEGDATGSVTFTGARAGQTSVEVRSLPIWAEVDGRQEDAERIRDLFIPWIEVNYPELGITADTGWQPTIVQPQILVVSHYLFLTDAWEMGVQWHVMMAPDDWANMYLRHRFDEAAPSIAATITSVIDQVPPTEAEPPDAVYR
jgi:hypothetical protein